MSAHRPDDGDLARAALPPRSASCTELREACKVKSWGPAPPSTIEAYLDRWTDYFATDPCWHSVYCTARAALPACSTCTTARSVGTARTRTLTLVSTDALRLGDAIVAHPGQTSASASTACVERGRRVIAGDATTVVAV